jgi:hypothetical protein
MRAADGLPAALSFRRLAGLLLPEFDDLRQQLVDIWIDGLDLIALAHEFG